MVKHWWKILAVLLLLYTFVFGLLIPLKPGIHKVSPQKIIAGEKTEIKVTGYNTNFVKARESLAAWIKISDDESFPITNITPISEQELTLSFTAPYLANDNKRTPATLIMNNALDGATIYPEGLIYLQEKLERFGQVASVWQPFDYDQVDTKEGTHFPYRSVIHETVRNTFFHVSLWFSMMILLIISLYNSIMLLRTNESRYDHQASSYVTVSIIYGALGIITGSIWARFTWGTFWTADIKLNMSAIAWLIYAAYVVLRMSIDDPDRKAKVTAVYNIFAFFILVPLIFIIPRLTSSLHPGNGGNPALGGEDLDNTLRMVFYPSIIGMTLLGIWIAQLRSRIMKLTEKVLFN